jgi:hypothetical protein
VQAFGLSLGVYESFFADFVGGDADADAETDAEADAEADGDAETGADGDGDADPDAGSDSPADAVDGVESGDGVVCRNSIRRGPRAFRTGTAPSGIAWSTGSAVDRLDARIVIVAATLPGVGAGAILGS